MNGNNIQSIPRPDTPASLLHGLSARPAFAAFTGVTFLLISFQHPLYGIAFVPLLLFFLASYSPFARKATLLMLVVTEILLCAGLLKGGDGARCTGQLPGSGTGTVEAVIPRPSGMAVILRTGGVRVRLTLKQGKPPEPGDSIRFKAEWYPVNPVTVPGTFDAARWLASQRLAGYGKLTAYAVAESRWIPEKSFSAFRLWLSRRLAAHFGPAETGLLLGLLAGDRSGISDALQGDFRRTGLVHVLSISGFHIVLLAGMLMLFLKATRLPHTAARIVAMALMIIYIPVTGASAPVCRAVFMFLVVQCGFLCERKADALNSLGVALLLLTLYDTDIVWDIGFQLSGAATAGIIVGQGHYPLKNPPEALKESKFWKFADAYLLQPCWTTFIATLATAPFLVHHFQTLSPTSLLGNLAVVPLIALAMEAGLFYLLSPLNFLQIPFAAAGTFLLRLAAFLTRYLADFKGSSLTVGPFDAWVLCLTGAAIVLLPAFRTNVIARRAVIATAVLFGGLFLYMQAEHILRTEWEVTILDAGQGDCILIKSPRQDYFVIDAGVNKGKRDFATNTLIPFLRNEGVQSLRALIITHPDADHFGGAEVLLKTFPVKELWTQECARIEPKPEWQRALAASADHGIPIRDIYRGWSYRERTAFPFMNADLWEMQAFNPDPFRCKETNTSSIVLRIRGAGGSVLLTGDFTIQGEQELLATNIDVQSDILKLGHHGSKTSSSREFLRRVAPELAIASAGKNNRFHHPSKQVVARLDSLRIPLLNTAESGSIRIRFSADSPRTPEFLTESADEF